jgi:hypothetical protein
MNASLLKPFLEEEVQCAIFQMAPDKTSRPNGYPAGFFQKNWSTLGGDICNTILGVLNTGRMPYSLNKTHIALILRLKILVVLWILGQLVCAMYFIRSFSRYWLIGLKKF